MKALYLKYKDFIMEVIHFGMVGVINTLMGWVIMAVLYNLIHMSYWVSSGISYFIGSVFSYHANAKPFTARALDALGLSADGRVSVALLDNIAMFLGMCFFIVMNFFGQKFFVFRKRGIKAAEE